MEQQLPVFLRAELLIGYLETKDFECARRGMAAHEINERFRRETADFFVPLTIRCQTKQ